MLDYGQMASGHMESIAGSVSGWLGSRYAKKASRAAQEAYQRSAVLQEDYGRDVVSAELELGGPYREASYSAIAGLMDMVGLPRTGAGLVNQVDLTDAEQNQILQKWYTTWRKNPGGNPIKANQKSWQAFMTDFKSGALADVNKELEDATAAKREQYADAGTSTGSGSQSDLLRGHGVSGTSELMDRPMFNWQADPGYKFRLKEGIAAGMARMGHRGMGNSGAEIKALTEYAGGLASEEYGKVFSRLAQIAGFGGIAAGQSSHGFGIGANMISGAAGAIENQGLAKAAGYMGRNAAWQRANEMHLQGSQTFMSGLLGSPMGGMGGGGGGTASAGGNSGFIGSGGYGGTRYTR